MNILFNMYNFKIYFVQLLLLVKTVTYAIPVSQEDPELDESTTPNIEPKNAFTNQSDPNSHEIQTSIDQNNDDERYDIRDAFKDIDVNIYKEIDEDGQFKTLCWAELLILTENNKNNNMTLSREFSIILESPGDIPKEHLADEEIVAYELVEGNTKKSKIMNFTTVSRTEEFTVREHQTLFCGAGPILTKEYSEWPKLNKKKLEIRLTPTTPTVWRVCRKNVLLENSNENKSTASCNNNTFDTTVTSEVLTATEKTTENSPSPSVSDKIKNRMNKIKIKSSKSITFLTEYNETSNFLNQFANMPHDLEYKTQPSDEENLQLSLDHLQQPEEESEVELLRRNMYFKKFNDAEENFNESVTTENNFRPLDNTFLFDLIFPDKKVLTSLYTAGVKHKFLIKIKIELEHRVRNGANGQERTDYLIGLEEDSAYHTAPSPVHL